MKEKALNQLKEIVRWVDRRGLNQVDNNGSKRGVITSGLVYLSLLEVLEGATEKPDILKLALVYPIAEETILRFLETHDEVKVLEELDTELEKSIKALAFDNKLSTEIHGKKNTYDWIGEYTPDKVRGIINQTWPGMLKESEPLPVSDQDIPLRVAQMCPGCGHRSAFHAIGAALTDDTITVADIGCHTLGFQEPYNLGEVLLCMGASPGIGSGLSLFNEERKVVAFIGDSTLFHAGLPGIINSIFNNHNITLVVMENGTTAMTGHQDHPGSGKNFNDVTEPIPLRQLLEGFGIKSIRETDTYKQQELQRFIEEAVEEVGLSVLIAKHPCMLLFAKKQRRAQNFIPHHVHIDQKICERIYSCVEEFGCPSFIRNTDGSITVNNELCIGDGSCIQTCPTKAISR